MKFLIYPATAILALTVAGSAFARQCEDRYQVTDQSRPHDWNAFQAQCELSASGGGNSGAAVATAIPRPGDRPFAYNAGIPDGTDYHANDPFFGRATYGGYHETYGRATGYSQGVNGTGERANGEAGRYGTASPSYSYGTNGRWSSGERYGSGGSRTGGNGASG